uniref:Putative ORF3b protein n=1 Tax=Severe acute respiratory syndrome coronavirus 2 TaxID=2697049 RepID=ORF3B_SARS2|nr:RecName: Full=Putative ORF3b protein; Short=ORF3b [Severe acute respiratory syndrome coronavirus 2]
MMPTIFFAGILIVTTIVYLTIV